MSHAFIPASLRRVWQCCYEHQSYDEQAQALHGQVPEIQRAISASEITSKAYARTINRSPKSVGDAEFV